MKNTHKIVKTRMFYERSFISKKHLGEHLNFLEYIPLNDEVKIPLLIYIHVAGSRGNALSEMADIGPIKELKMGRKIDAVIIAPQCHNDTWFDLKNIILPGLKIWCRGCTPISM